MAQSNRNGSDENNDKKTLPYDYWVNKVKCPNSHSLMPFYATNSSQYASYTLHKFICDSCNQQIQKCENPYCCRQCDYDLCRTCYRNEYKQLESDGYGIIKYIAYDHDTADLETTPIYHRPSLVLQFWHEYRQKQIKDKIPLNNECIDDIIENIDSLAPKYRDYGIKIIINILKKTIANIDSKYDDINFRKLFHKLKIEENDDCKYLIQILCAVGYKLYHKNLGFYPELHDLNNCNFKLLRLVYGDYNYDASDWINKSVENESLCHAYHELKYRIGCNYKIDHSNYNTDIANTLLTNPWELIINAYFSQYARNNMYISRDIIELIYCYGKSLRGIVKINAMRKYEPIQSPVECDAVVVRYLATDSIVSKQKIRTYVYCNATQY